LNTLWSLVAVAVAALALVMPMGQPVAARVDFGQPQVIRWWQALTQSPLALEARGHPHLQTDQMAVRLPLTPSRH
jgi:hypothetical protein